MCFGLLFLSQCKPKNLMMKNSLILLFATTVLIVSFVESMPMWRRIDEEDVSLLLIAPVRNVINDVKLVMTRPRLF